jgi:hypothetical protein
MLAAVVVAVDVAVEASVLAAEILELFEAALVRPWWPAAHFAILFRSAGSRTQIA